MLDNSTRIYLVCFLLFIILPAYGSNNKNDLESILSSHLAEHYSQSSIPCRFLQDFIIQQHWDQLSSELRNILKKPSGKPPQLQDSTISSSGKFMLHYNRNGVHAVPDLDISGNSIPDYIDSACVILDYVWEIEIDSLGFQPPLDVDEKPISIYHVYFMNLSDAYGTTYTEQEIPGDPGVYRYKSYIILDNDYSEISYYIKGLNALKVTAAHEFNHAIQLSYRVWWENQFPIDYYFMEMTSTWIEDVVFEDINRYVRYLPDLFYNFSNTSFDYPDNLYPYGNALFLHMLEKEFGFQIVKEIWEKIKDKKSLLAIPEILSDYGTSFSYQLHQYGIWLFFTGNQSNNTNYFPEGHLYPELHINSDDIYQYSSELTIYKTISPLSNRILQINIPGKGAYLGTVYSDITNSLITHFSSGQILVSMPFNQQVLLYLTSNSQLMLLLTNTNTDSAIIKYTLLTDTVITDDLIRVFPNPVNINEDKKVTFNNVPADGQIYIYSVDGQEIANLSMLPNKSSLFWNLNDNMGQVVSTGIYLYLVKGNGIEKLGKIAIVR
jgi:hypothetical protein